MELAPLFICFVAGIFVGWRISDHIHQSVMPDMFRRLGIKPQQLEQVMQDLKKELGQEEPTKDSTEICIKVEQHGEQLYVYRKDNDEFLGQGKNKDEILKILQSKFQNVKFSVTKEDGADLLQLSNPTA